MSRQFELILEDRDNSATRVLTPQEGDSPDDILLDLKNFSGKLRVRRIISTKSGSAALTENEPSVGPAAESLPKMAEEARARGKEELSKSTNILPLAPDHGLDAALLPKHSSSAASLTNTLRVLNGSSRRSQEFKPPEAHPKNGAEQRDENCLPRFPPPLSPLSIRSQSAASTIGAVPPISADNGQSIPSIPGATPINRVHTADYNFIPHHRHRRRSHKRMSMRDVTQLDSALIDTQGQTTLHRICASSSIDVLRVMDLLERHPDMVKCKDANGRLPLHILGNNSELLDFHDGQKMATKCALLLMDAYPDGIVALDFEGRMPFTYLILKWIEWTFESDDQRPKDGSVLGNGAGRCSVSAVISKLNQKLHTVQESIVKIGTAADTMREFKHSILKRRDTDGSDGKQAIDSLRDSLQKSSARFPPVMIFDEVEWCFEMLSYGMDHLGGKPLNPGKKVRPQLAYDKQRDDRYRLAKNIAEIPLLFKTVLLLESKQTRSYILLECAAIRRALFCPDVIGPWLTSMIRYKKGTSSDVAIDFLHILSDLKVDDYIGTYRKAVPRDEKNFRASKLELYEAVEKLGDVIPSLLLAGEKATDHAVTTSLIYFVMQRRISTPFTVGLSMTDFKLHIVAMVAFRQAMLDKTNGEEIFKLFPWMTLTSVIWSIALHHLTRKACETVALARISVSSANNVLFEFWSVLDIMSLLLAGWAIVHESRSNDDDVDSPFFVAIILGTLWVRLLGFLKVVNEHLATFILALTRMFRDIRFFAIVMFIFILTFGDMFQLVVQSDDNIDCTAEELDPAIEEFCSPRSIDSYLRTYAIVVGDLEFEQYNNFGAITFLWFCTTFLGTIMLLNVLIAVVTLSLSNSQESSVILFRRARAHFLAGHAAMEEFIRPSASKWNEKMPTFSPYYFLLIFLRWSMVLTFLFTTLWTSLYVVELVVYSIRQERWALTVAGVLLALNMFYSLLFASIFTTVTFIEQIVPSEGEWRDRILVLVEKANVLMAENLNKHIFGIDLLDTEGGKVSVGPNADVMNRLDKLESMVQQVLTREERDEDEKIEANFEITPLMESSNEEETTDFKTADA